MSPVAFNFLVLILPGLTFAFPGSYQLLGWVLSAIGIIYVLRDSNSRHRFFKICRNVAPIPAYFFFAAVCIVIFAIHEEPASFYGTCLPFVIFPVILIALDQQKLDSRNFFIGAAIGGLVALGIAVFQVYHLGMVRAEGFNGPIRFGNTSVVLGSAALVGFGFFRKTIKSNFVRALLCVGGVAGLTASLLSGSKGGWLSLIMVALIFSSILTERASWAKRLFSVFFTITALIAVVWLMPRTTVLDRILSAYNGTAVWISTGKVTDGSASIRLETNKMAWFIAMKSPLIGIPTRDKPKRMEEVVSERLVDKVVLDYKVIDNEVLETLVSKGFLGLLGTLAIHVSTFFAFFRFRNDPVVAVRALAALGMLLPIMYFEFGLASAIFSTTIFRTIYISWSITLLGLILAERYRSHQETEPSDGARYSLNQDIENPAVR